MRSRPPGRRLAAMPAVPARRVVLDLDLRPGPIAGTVEDEDGVPRRFAGWLELCALLDAARTPAVAPPTAR